ncbi:hypothetical protein [Actinomadura sp. HBU206391]|uniref:hypothetical protein n=1 Tax=Actinomadura sp. HBU206391 TaxID=2731692 RepID=UPI00164FDB73|nr:hypothetical protein [Actinomadura sp. HBU206391]MBC6462677.1 hypothetical protein [Actinomadura sp. HBU206391]
MILDDVGMTNEQILALSDDVLLAATVEFLHRYGPTRPSIQELSTRTVRDVLEGSTSDSAIP